MCRGSRKRDSHCHSGPESQADPSPDWLCRLPANTAPFLSLCNEERLRTAACFSYPRSCSFFFSPSHLLLVLFNFLQAFLPGSLISLYPSEPSPIIPMTGGDIFTSESRAEPLPLPPRPSALQPLWPQRTHWLFRPVGTFLPLFNSWLLGFLFLITCGYTSHNKSQSRFQVS